MSTEFATFRRCALQVNPYSYSQQYQGRDHGLTEEQYNQALADKCVANGIDVVGIADHGSVDHIAGLTAALEEAGVVVFPGFEISSSEKIHMVCLYPSGTSRSTLDKYIGALDVPPESPTEPSQLACTAISENVRRQGGFWFAAHIEGKNGLLRLNQDGGGFPHIWSNCDELLASQIKGKVEDLEEKYRQIVENKNPQYERTRPVALINARDVRHPDDLDDPVSYCWVKMTTPSLEALILACRDAESRVRLAHEVNPTFYSTIERVEIRRGYFDGFEADLSPNLNAIVGGRGTGKSTLVEAIRYALELQPQGKDAEKTHKEILSENFKQEKASIHIALRSHSQNSERYTIVRQYGESSTVLDDEGSLTSLRPKDLLPRVEVYGQNELLTIVHDEDAKADLLRRFLQEDEALLAELERSKDALRHNRESIVAELTALAKVKADLEGLPALLDRRKSYQKLALDSETTKVKLRAADSAFSSAIGDSFERLATAISDLEKAVESESVPEIPTEKDTAHQQLLQEMVTAFSKTREKIVALIRDAQSALNEGTTALESVATRLKQAIAEEEHNFGKVLDNLPSERGKPAAQLASELQEIEQSIAILEPKKKLQSRHVEKVEELRRERDKLHQQSAELTEPRWSALSGGVRSLNRRLERLLRISFEAKAVRSPLRDFLLGQNLEGVGQRRLDWIDDAESLSVIDLAKTIRKGRDAIATAYASDGLTPSVASALASMPEPALLELEEVELQDRLELLLNVGGETPNFREVGRLSTGQQCTAVLHLLLLDNKDPLIIDQPEDNLDNAFIAEHIVQELRVGKVKRQYVFATHNANIPVFGDAEWIGVLEEEDRQGQIRHSGSIDADDVKEQVAAILEGGKEAFTRRKEKYGL